jgi:hypothetical protein
MHSILVDVIDSTAVKRPFKDRIFEKNSENAFFSQGETKKLMQGFR